MTDAADRRWHNDEATHQRIELIRIRLRDKYSRNVTSVLDEISKEFFLTAELRTHLESATKIFCAEYTQLDENRLSALELNLKRLHVDDIDQLKMSLRNRIRGAVEGKDVRVIGPTIDLTEEPEDVPVPEIIASFDNRQFKFRGLKRLMPPSAPVAGSFGKKLKRPPKHEKTIHDITQWIEKSQKSKFSKIPMPECSTGSDESSFVPSLLPNCPPPEKIDAIFDRLIGDNRLTPHENERNETNSTEPTVSVPVVRNSNVQISSPTFGPKKRMIQRYNSHSNLQTERFSLSPPAVESTVQVDENQNTFHMPIFKRFLNDSSLLENPPPPPARKSQCEPFGKIAKEQHSIASYKIKNTHPINPALYNKPAASKRKIISYDDLRRAPTTSGQKVVDPQHEAYKLSELKERLLKQVDDDELRDEAIKLGGCEARLKKQIKESVKTGEKTSESSKSSSETRQTSPLIIDTPPPATPVKKRRGRPKLIQQEPSTPTSQSSTVDSSFNSINATMSSHSTSPAVSISKIARKRKNAAETHSEVPKKQRRVRRNNRTKAAANSSKKRPVRTCTVKTSDDIKQALADDDDNDDDSPPSPPSPPPTPKLKIVRKRRAGKFNMKPEPARIRSLMNSLKPMRKKKPQEPANMAENSNSETEAAVEPQCRPCQIEILDYFTIPAPDSTSLTNRNRFPELTNEPQRLDDTFDAFDTEDISLETEPEIKSEVDSIENEMAMIHSASELSQEAEQDFDVLIPKLTPIDRLRRDFGEDDEEIAPEVQSDDELWEEVGEMFTHNG